MRMLNDIALIRRAKELGISDAGIDHYFIWLESEQRKIHEILVCIKVAL